MTIKGRCVWLETVRCDIQAEVAVKASRRVGFQAILPPEWGRCGSNGLNHRVIEADTKRLTDAGNTGARGCDGAGKFPAIVQNNIRLPALYQWPQVGEQGGRQRLAEEVGKIPVENFGGREPGIGPVGEHCGQSLKAGSRIDPGGKGCQAGRCRARMQFRAGDESYLVARVCQRLRERDERLQVAVSRNGCYQYAHGFVISATVSIR